MTDKKKRKRRNEPTDMSASVSPESLEENLIPHIPGTPEEIASTMFGKRMMPDGTFQYTEEGLRRVRQRRANQQ